MAELNREGETEGVRKSDIERYAQHIKSKQYPPLSQMQKLTIGSEPHCSLKMRVVTSPVGWQVFLGVRV